MTEKQTVFYGATIRCAGSPDRVADALAICGSRIAFIGKEPEMRSLFPKARYVSLAGKTLLPGFVDSHCHVELYAHKLQNVNLVGACSLQEALDRIRERAQITPAGKLILGRGWNKNEWETHSFPTCFDLDSVSTEHPIAMFSKDGHAAWANSLALAQSGITRNTADPDGGKIQRADHNGEPTGILFESAEGLLDPLREKPDQETLKEWLHQSMVSLSQDGITAVRTPDGVSAFRAYQQLLQDDRIPVRLGYYYPNGYIDSLAKTGVSAPFGCDRLAVCGVKAFIDGALGSQTAEMFDCYENAPDNFGISTMEDAEVLELFTTATQGGLPVAMHAIGDKANHRVLNAIEQVQQALPDCPMPRHAIEHAQLLRREDIDRMAKTGTIASMQPLHVSGDWKMADRHWGERSSGAYPFRTLLECGARLAFGSDCPVEEASPLLGIRAAITRTDLRRQPEGGWYPEQILNPWEALRAYTLEGAYAMGFESLIGSLTEGKKADLVVLDADPITSDPFELSSAQVVLTMMNGDVTHHRGDLDLE